MPVVNLLDAENYNHFTVGPAEFVWLFANSSLTFTNSFHGVAFSILFKSPFINREVADDSLGVAMSARMATLLKLFGLENRSVDRENNYTLDELLKVDFSHCDEVLIKERAKAFKFLLEALGL